jgi:hypothetical protein
MIPEYYTGPKPIGCGLAVLFFFAVAFIATGFKEHSVILLIGGFGMLAWVVWMCYRAYRIGALVIRWRAVVCLAIGGLIGTIIGLISR